jgi:hypothetical protein
VAARRGGGGQEGAIAAGRRGRQKRVVAVKEGGDKYDICPWAPETLAPPLSPMLPSHVNSPSSHPDISRRQFGVQELILAVWSGSHVTKFFEFIPYIDYNTGRIIYDSEQGLHMSIAEKLRHRPEAPAKNRIAVCQLPVGINDHIMAATTP